MRYYSDTYMERSKGIVSKESKLCASISIHDEVMSFLYSLLQFDGKLINSVLPLFDTYMKLIKNFTLIM